MGKIEILVSVAVTFVTTVIPSVLALLTAIKSRKGAKTEAEKERAKNAIATELKRLVANAEISFAPIDRLLKAQSQSAGSMKKRDVIANLKTFCLENGFAWDDEAMDKAIEDEVAYTKVVNSK